MELRNRLKSATLKDAASCWTGPTGLHAASLATLECKPEPSPTTQNVLQGSELLL